MTLVLPVDAGQAGSADELRGLAECLRLLLDNAHTGIILCDRRSKILYMNRFYADLLQTDRDKAVGRHIKTFFPESRLPSVLESGQVELGRRCSLRSDLALLVNRIPIKKRGETIGVLLQTLFKDYTEVHELMARLSSLEREVRYYKRGLTSVLSATYRFDSIVGESAPLLEAKRMAAKYSRRDTPVLILGATGTGKELFAHAIHQASRRRKGAFVCVNCAAIPRELLESELFGYETGAFTGARRQGKAGKIELAHHGTLFLDEIGDLPLNAQAKLLRVLETHSVERLGGLKSVAVDFRLVASTNRDLREMIGQQTFREDLFYRINTLTIVIPALAERPEDILLLVRHFLQYSEKPSMRVADTAMRLLQTYPWPGNVRELRNVIERAVSLADSDVIDLEHLPTEMREFNCGHQALRPAGIKPLSKALACCEKEVIQEALGVTGGNMRQTAKLLGISRSTLYEKCRIHGISNPKIPASH